MSEPALKLSAASGSISRALLGTAMLAMLLLLGGQLWLSFRDKVKTAEISTHNIAAIFEARLDATLRHTDADLTVLTGEIPRAALNVGTVARHAREVNYHLASRMYNRDEMAGYRVHDASGNMLYSSGVVRGLANIADQAYFRQLRDDVRAGLVISDVFDGDGNGQQVLIVARAVRDGSGRFLGVVSGLIDLEYYRRQFLTLDLGKQGLIALRRDTHEMVLRFPDLPGQTNKSLPADHPVVRGMSPGERTMVLHYSAAPDFVPRILSIVRMRDFPFFFAVGLGRDEVLSGWYQQVVVVVASALLLFALVALLLVRLHRAQLRQNVMLGDLAVSEAQFRELAQLVPVGICYFDLQGECTYVNQRCVSIAGRSCGDLLGGNWQEFVHPEDRDKLLASWVRCVAPGCAYVCEFRFVHSDGQLAHVLAEVQAGLNASGELKGYLAALTDISLRKQTEAELLVAKQRAESADLSKTRFLAAASHDLRQPIQAINLFQDALRRTDLSEEQKTISDFLSRSVHALGELLYSLLDISKLDAGQIKPQPRGVEIEDLFRAIDAEFSTLARQKNLRFKLFFPFERRVLFTDPGLLMSVIRNLVDNALKYTERGGVLVGVRQRQGKIVIQVWDTGVGIEPDYGSRIFEECFQVGDAVLDRSKGLGLGLTIARRMAQLLGCELSYTSRPGKGSVFEVVLPPADDCLVGAVSSTGAAPGASLGGLDVSRFSGWKMVIIEDDPMVAKAVEMSLDEIGVQVRVFQSAEAALADPDIFSADFYISDFNLPGINGIEMLNGIQARSVSPVRAVLMTGEIFPAREVLESSSSWPVLFKPVEMANLLAVMKTVVDGAVGERGLYG